MTDRLQELLRQRALLQEHLTWLNREIAAAEGIPSLPTPVDKPTKCVAPTTLPAVKSSAEAERILGEFKKDANAMKTDTRHGCLIMFAVAMGFFALAVLVGYYFYARHLGRWW